MNSFNFYSTNVLIYMCNFDKETKKIENIFVSVKYSRIIINVCQLISTCDALDVSSNINDSAPFYTKFIIFLRILSYNLPIIFT